MNSFLKSIVVMLSGMLIVSSCSNQKGGEEMKGNKAKTFATPEEAAGKAKSDLIQVLETHKELNLGVDAAKLRDAQPGKFIRYAEVDFEKLLASDSVRSLSEIVAADKSMIAPFVVNNEVVGVVQIGKVSDGWRVTELGNKGIMDDLNQAGIARRGRAVVTVYEVPNLQILVYGVREKASEYYFLNFERYTLRDSVAVTAFYRLIREKARQFNEQFGDQLKKEKLVK